MTYIHTTSVTVTTAADGSATAYSELVNGLLSQVRYVKTDFANGVDFTITDNTTGATLWAEDNVDASATRAPRQATHSTAGVAATYDGTRAVLERIPVNGQIKIVIANGGNTKTGVFHFTLE